MDGEPEQEASYHRAAYNITSQGVVHGHTHLAQVRFTLDKAMFVLDTNVVSELRKVRLGQVDANVTAWTESVDATDLFVSVITLMELELGVLSIERKDAIQGGMLRSWLEQHVLPEFSGRTLPVDTAVAQRSARLHVPHRRGERDALIAATALVHGMTLITRNVADFKPTGVTLINPWELSP